MEDKDAGNMCRCGRCLVSHAHARTHDDRGGGGKGAVVSPEEIEHVHQGVGGGGRVGRGRRLEEVAAPKGASGSRGIDLTHVLTRRIRGVLQNRNPRLRSVRT